METMHINVALSGNMRGPLENRVREGGFASVEEYVRSLVEQDIADGVVEDDPNSILHPSNQDWLEGELLKALESGPGSEMTDGDWNQMKREARERAAAAKRR